MDKPLVVIVGGDDINYAAKTSPDWDLACVQLAGQVGWHQQQVCKQVETISAFEPFEIVQAIAKIEAWRPVHRIFSFKEEALLATAEAAHEMDIPGISLASTRLAIDKIEMRKAFIGTPFEIDFSPLDTTTPTDAANAFLAQHKDGIVIKDHKGAGSVNVFICRQSGDIEEAISLSKEKSIRMIMEPLLEGTEYSVETLSLNGRHHILGVTQKTAYRDQLFEKQQTFPAQSLSLESQHTISNAVAAVLDRIGHKLGPAHIEIFLQGSTVHLIEINSRIAGDLIWLLAEAVTGIDTIEETISASLSGATSPAVTNRYMRSEIAITRALFNRIDTREVERHLPSDVQLLHTTVWADYRRPDSITTASQRYGFMALGFKSKKQYMDSMPVIENHITALENIKD